MEELINRLYEIDPETIANSFVAIRAKLEKRTEKDDEVPNDPDYDEILLNYLSNNFSRPLKI